MPMSALDTLFSGLIDFAGLFPPANLDMPAAVRAYARFRKHPRSLFLGGLVLPVARLDEFGRVLAAMSHDERGRSAWRVSALVGDDVDGDLSDAVRRAAPDARIPNTRIDAIDLKVASPRDIERTSAAVPRTISMAYEIPLGLPRAERWSLLEAVASAGRMAKLRAGGVTATAIPTTVQVGEFIWDCARSRVPFRATSGLHHTVRGRHRLTDATDSPTAVTHGLLNVLLASAAAWTAVRQVNAESLADPPAALMAALQEEEPGAFSASDDAVRWREMVFPQPDVSATRAGFARSFGLRSFLEPIAELTALGWFPRV
jgi:hypothetical protein